MAVGRAGAESVPRARRLTALTVCIAVLSTAPARAGVPPPEKPNTLNVALLTAGLLVLPSDIGLFIPAWGPDFLLGWSYQLAFTENRRHRIIGGIDWIPTSDTAHLRIRGGYRYTREYFIAGLMAAHAATGGTWSPEAGVRLGAEGRPGLHLLARAEIPIAVDGFRGVAVLAGWDMR